LKGKPNELCLAIAQDSRELGGTSRAERPSGLFEVTQMLPRDLELFREIGLAHILAKSYRSQHFSECEGAARQFLEKLLGIDRAVGIPLDLLLSLSSHA